MRKEVLVKTNPGYPVYIEPMLLASGYVYDFLKKITLDWVVISDSNLVNTHVKTVLENMGHNKLNSDFIYFPAGERNKTRETKLEIENRMLARNHGRDVAILAIGGGVTTDLAGFVAATYNRGVPVVYFPTSLLCMVDASIGGKTAVNTTHGKNLIGAFYQPKAVFIDVMTLKTLPREEYKSGLVEALIHSLIFDSELFGFIKQNTEKISKLDYSFLCELVYESCKAKARVVEKDEKENEMRKILNFGHTIGHAIELCANYEISHGKAVAMGIVTESFVSYLSGSLDQAVFQQIKQSVDLLNLSLSIPSTIRKSDIKDAMRLDKKSRNNVPHFVMLSDIGVPVTINDKYAFKIQDSVLNKALDYLVDTFCAKK